ncbi:MAG: porin [Rhodocyclaceae bacterium]|nr:porin [Rhodocyclaceae bacterium]
MQKKLIALAIAGLSSAAFAQSNVTIYGTMDAGFETARAGGATPTAAGLSGRDMAGRNRITTNSSNIGFKGAESLGNGLTAVFQIETQISADGSNSASAVPNVFGNTSGSVWNTRDTYMGIAGGFGTVAIGYLSTPHRTLAASYDVMPGATGSAASTTSLIGRINVGTALNAGTTAVGTTANNFGGTTALGGGVTGANSVVYLSRENAIAYITPTFNGFSGVIAYVPNEGKFGSPNVNPGNGKNPAGWNLALNYANGPLKVGFSHLALTDAGVLAGVTAGSGTTTGLVTGGEKHKANLFGAAYTFNGATTVSFLWDNFKGTVSTVAGTAGGDITVKRNAYMIGVKHVMGAHEIAGQYSKAKSVDVGGPTALAAAAAGNSFGGSGANMFALRYGYNFSKRTQAYVLYSQINNGSDGNYDFGTGGAVANTVSVDGTNRINAGADPRAFGVGLRHSF